MPPRSTAGIDDEQLGTSPADAPRPHLTAVIPARNESRRIGATIADLWRWVDEIVVVDDASDDATGSVAAAAGATVIRCDRRLGYIAAITCGFRAVSDGIVVTVDADGEMPVERIPELIAPIAAGAADMVQGHRSSVPRISERAITAIASIAGPVGDSGTGFRALRADLARELEIPGSCICGTFTLSVLARGATVAEVAVDARRVPNRRRRIAWNHLGQALLVARMATRARRRGVRTRTGPV